MIDVPAGTYKEPKDKGQEARNRTKHNLVMLHAIAAGFHKALNQRNMTADEFIELADRELEATKPHKNAVYAMMLARPHAKVTLRFLAEVMYLLKFEWDFRIVRRLTEEEQNENQ